MFILHTFRDLAQEVRMKTLMEIAAVSNTNLTALNSPGPLSSAIINKNAFTYVIPPADASSPHPSIPHSFSMSKEEYMRRQSLLHDSHIYYLNTPPSLPTTFKTEPIYEPIADSLSPPPLSHHRNKHPSLPPRPVSHKSQQSQNDAEEEEGSVCEETHDEPLDSYITMGSAGPLNL